MRSKIVVGWNENVDLPEWGIKRLGAKVDTGAQTSALHVENVEPIGRGRIRFDVVVHREKRDRHFPVTARVARRARVRSSNGHYDVRYFVETTVRIGPVEKTIEISLVDRGKMAHRMLLGRSALRGDFVVDVSRRHVLDKPKRKANQKTKKQPSSSPPARRPVARAARER